MVSCVLLSFFDFKWEILYKLQTICFNYACKVRPIFPRPFDKMWTLFVRKKGMEDEKKKQGALIGLFSRRNSLFTLNLH